MITTAEDYLYHLVAELIHNRDTLSTDVTTETIGHQVGFSSTCDLSPLLPHGYSDQIIQALCAAILKMPIGPTIVTNLDYYQKKFGTWFDGPTIQDYVADIVPAIYDAVVSLNQDPTSRRAVIRMTGNKCATSYQFLLREVEGQNLLMCVGNFRSLDAWRGLPADLVLMQSMTKFVCDKVVPGAKLGYIINASSFHIYNDAVDEVSDLLVSLP